METFLLIAILCTDSNVCQSYVLDHSLTQDYCDSYFTDNGLMRVDELVYVIVSEEKEPLTLQSIDCVQEDTE